MGGEDFLSKLEEAIEYVNQEVFNIRFSAKGGKISPSGDQLCRVSDQFTLLFTEDREICFLNWEVLLNGEYLDPATAANYVSFENIDSPETKITINARADNLTVQANVAERPKVIKASPQSEDEGVPCDRTIVVMFNQEIDESSIYWTNSELKELGVDSSKAFAVDGKTDCYYSYWDGKDKNTIQYKNIKISNYQNNNVNYLQYYGVPKLDVSNKKILRIPLARDPVTNQTKLPPLTEIMVILNKDFSYVVEKKDTKQLVGLTEDYTWTYLTNESHDDIKPEFVETDQYGFRVTVADNNQTKYDLSKQLGSFDANNVFNALNISNFKKTNLQTELAAMVKLNAKNKKLWIRGSFKDNQGGSGPASLNWQLYNISSKTYYGIATSDKPISTGSVDELTINGLTASINKNIDDSGIDMGGAILELKDLSKEGFYRIDFWVTDNSANNSEKKSFYFVYDTVCDCDIDNIKIESSEFATIKTQKNGKLKNNTNDGVQKHWSYLKTEVNNVTLEESEENQFDFYINTKGNYLYVKVKVTDIFGNYKEKESKIFLIPAIGAIYYSDGFWSIDYDSKRTPIGIICNCDDNFDGKVDETDQNVRIIALSKVEEKYTFGINKKDGDKDDTEKMNKDGLENSKTLEKAEGYVGYYFQEKNNNNSIKTWYLPSNDELNDLFSKRNTINESLNRIPQNITHDSTVFIDGTYLTSKFKEKKIDFAKVYNICYIFTVSESTTKGTEGSKKYSEANGYVLSMAKVPR